MKKLSLILFSTLILFKTSLISTEIKFIQWSGSEVIDGDTIVINNIRVRFLELMHLRKIKFVPHHLILIIVVMNQLMH